MRKLVLGLIGLLVVAVAAVAVIVLTIDLNGYKPEIEAELERATGRDVTIGGDIQFTFQPSLAVAVDDLEVAGVPGASGDPLLRLPRLEAVVSLLPLLSGAIEVESVRLVEPVVVLERAADGTASWALAPVEAAEGGEPATVSVARFEIADGVVLWREGGQETRIEALSLEASAGSLDGPFEGKGGFVHDGRPWTLTADIGRVSRPQIPVNLVLASDLARLALAGSIDLSGGAAAFSGQVQGEGPSLGPVAALGGLEMPQGVADQPFSVDAGLSVSPERLRLADAVIELGASRVFAEGEVVLAERPSAQVTLSAVRLDLDALLPPTAATGSGGETAFAVPRDFDLAADLSVEALIVNGQALRQVQLAVDLADGTLAIGQASAELPGGTDVALAGTIADEEGVPTFRGPIEANSDNLRATFAWLGEDLPDVPADRLRRVDLVADAVLQPGVVALTGIDLRFDSSRLTGAVAARTDDAVTVTAEVALDRINLDAYLGAARREAETAPGDGGAFAMPALPEINLDLEARIEQLTYNGVLVTGVVADGTLFEGKLQVDSLGAADIAGASIRTSGDVDPEAGRIDLKLGLQAEDAGGLLRLLGIDLPIDPARLGAVALAGEITGGTDQAVVRQRLDTGLGQASIDGTLLDALGQPGFDGRIGLRADSYRTLAQALDLALPDTADSEIAFAADITTDGHKVETNAVVELLGLTARATGHADDLQGSPGYDLRLVAEHAELADLMAALGASGGSALGAAKLDLQAVGDAGHANVTLAPSHIGESTFRGTIALDLSGARPAVEARLQAGGLALDPFLAAGSGGTLGNESDGGERWSAEPIDLSVLAAFDGRIEMTAERATLQGMALGTPTIVASVGDGTLTVERFDGTLFDGRFAMTGSVAQGVPHRIALDLALGDADAEAMLRHFADSDRLRGRAFLQAKVDAVGLSQRDLVQTLAGNGSLSLRDGVVEGFDLGRISDRLGNLDNEVAIVALLGEAGSGGETAVQAADGTFVMTDGIARSDDLKVVLDGGKADFTMTADLPRWWIDLAGTAVLTEHARAPGIPISVRGPIDAPTRTVDTSALQGFLMQRAAETALRKLGGEQGGTAGTVLDLLSGGGQQQAAPEPATPEQGESPPPQDGGAAGSLLDLLTGGGSQQPPAPEQQQGGTLDGEALLQDLLKSFGD